MKRMLAAVSMFGILCAAAQAQEAKPAPELKKLEILVGEWTFQGQSKDPETGEEWTDKGTGQYSRLGEFFYVWRGETEDGGSFLEIDAYDPVTKGIVRHSFSSDGWQGTSSVTLRDETMSFDITGVTATGEKTRSRCTVDFVVPVSTGECEVLIDGKWVAAGTGTHTKVK